MRRSEGKKGMEGKRGMEGEKGMERVERMERMEGLERAQRFRSIEAGMGPGMQPRHAAARRRASADGLSPAPAEARTLEVVRCSAFGPNAHEPRQPDGTAQLRLPLGAWIVALRTRHELEAAHRRSGRH